MKHARVLIADDHPMVCEALDIAVRSALSNCAVDIVHSITEAEAQLRKRSDYSFVLLDLNMPGVRGFSGLSLIQQLSGCPVIVVSGTSDAETVALARTFGAAGFIDKASGMGEVGSVLKRIVEGESLFPSNAAAPPASTDAARALSQLSPAQLRIMLAVADGRSNKQIAYDLGLSEATVKVHVSASFKKLGVPNRARAVLLLSPLTQF